MAIDADRVVADEFRLLAELFPQGLVWPTGGALPKSNGDHEGSPDGGAWSCGTAPTGRAAGDRVVDLDVSWLVPPDLSAVDVLVRLQVAASRRGRWLQLHGAGGGLVELLEFVGLRDVVHLCRCCPSTVRHGEPRPGGR